MTQSKAFRFFTEAITVFIMLGAVLIYGVGLVTTFRYLVNDQRGFNDAPTATAEKTSSPRVEGSNSSASQSSDASEHLDNGRAQADDNGSGQNGLRRGNDTNFGVSGSVNFDDDSHRSGLITMPTFGPSKASKIVTIPLDVESMEDPQIVDMAKIKKCEQGGSL